MKMIHTVKVADFSITPFGRYPTDGKFSGQRFRREVLLPLFRNQNIDTIQVDFNGIIPVGSSFIDEAFAGLIRDEGLSFEQVWGRLTVISDFPLYEIQIKEFLNEVLQQGK